MGVSQGLGIELTKCSGIVAGFFVGFRWYQPLGDQIATRTFLSHEWAAALVLVSLVMAGYLVVGVGLRCLQKVVTLQFAASVDKIGGLVVALARAGLVMSVVLVTLQQLPSEYLRLSIEERSWSGRHLARLAPAMYDAAAPALAATAPGRHLPGGSGVIR